MALRDTRLQLFAFHAAAISAYTDTDKFVEARTGVAPVYAVLQTAA